MRLMAVNCQLQALKTTLRIQVQPCDSRLQGVITREAIEPIEERSLFSAAFVLRLALVLVLVSDSYLRICPHIDVIC